MWHRHRWSSVEDHWVSYDGCVVSIIWFRCLGCRKLKAEARPGSVQIEDLS